MRRLDAKHCAAAPNAEQAGAPMRVASARAGRRDVSIRIREPLLSQEMHPCKRISPIDDGGTELRFICRFQDVVFSHTVGKRCFSSKRFCPRDREEVLR